MEFCSLLSIFALNLVDHHGLILRYFYNCYYIIACKRFSRESEWQQISISLQDSPQYVVEPVIQRQAGNIIKYDLRIFNKRTNTLLYKNISFTLYSRKDWCFFGMWEMGIETYAKREDFFQYLLPGDANACTPLQARQRHLWSAACASLDCDSLHSVQIWSRGSLITWSLSGYTPVLPECPGRAVIFLFTNQNVTACQSTRGHLERTENKCHMFYNKYSCWCEQHSS